MRKLGILAFVIAAALQVRGTPPVPPEIVLERLAGAKPRSVVFILTDDHRYDAMSFLGHPLARTPVMDSMAKNGVYLKNAFVTTSLCSPSRASFLTGLYTFRHRVIDNNRPIPSGTIFFPQYLQQAGYATAFIGKWHMGGEFDDPQPGFDHWVSFKGQGNYLSPDPDYTLNVNGQRVKQRGYITDELTDYAVDWLSKQSPARKPFFLYLSHKAVHAHFTPAERHRGKYAKLKLPAPPTQTQPPTAAANAPRWLRDQRNSRHGVDYPYYTENDIGEYGKKYCETLCAVDESLGRILTQLKAMGILDDTLVIYTSDNGFQFSEHGIIDKRTAYDASMRIPLLMQCPNLLKAGTVVERMVANIDLAPTIMEAMGLAKPPHMDGQSFLPLALGKPTPWRDDLLYVYYWEKNYPQSPTVFALRGDRYKYITYYGLWDADELYDLQADPNETTNLFYDGKHQAIAKRMEQRLYQTLTASGGMYIPLNAPTGDSLNRRSRNRGGDQAADFPKALVADEPINQDAN